MIASFLHHVFVVPNVRTVARQQLMSQLDDHFYQMHQVSGETVTAGARGALRPSGRMGRAHASWRAARVLPGAAASSESVTDAAPAVARAQARHRTGLAVLQLARV
jgi:hypothetical protein